MAKKAAKPNPVEISTEPQAGSESHGRKLPSTKTEAIRMAMAAGFEGPQEGAAYIQSQFGLHVSPPNFSSMKSQIKKKESESKTKGEPERTPKALVEGDLPSPPKPSGGSEPDLLEAIKAMKPLVEAFGVDKVKKIADLLG